MESINGILPVVQSGLGSLAAYLAAHVILCLLPAFFTAGALMTLLPKEAITRYLGKDAPKWISYPASALGGFVLAVCSCTIMPLFASIYKKGAGLGPAITFLFVGPAVNILAISFTGVQIGLDIALARIILSLIFGIIIGLLMERIFRREEAARVAASSALFSKSGKIPGRNLALFALLVSILIIGTLQIPFLTDSMFDISIPSDWGKTLQSWLEKFIPANPDLGIEGVSVQGIFLVGLLVLITAGAFKGFGNVDSEITGWTIASLILIVLTLLFASMPVTVNSNHLTLGFTGRFAIELIFILAIWALAKNKFSTREVGLWLWETWRFVRQIMPLLLAGVFGAGMARGLIPANWIEMLAGRNTIWANLVGVLFGVFMYFPTLVEVPVAQTFLSLGMHRGPLLAYLLADPELSVQSVLITNTVIGKKKTAVYVILVIIFSTLSGWIFGMLIT